MSYLTPIKLDPLTPESAAELAANRVTPFSEYIGAKYIGELSNSWAGMLTREAVTPDLAPVKDELAIFPELERQREEYAPKPEVETLSEDEFTGIVGTRKIPYDPRMTRARAEALVEQHDIRRYRESLVERYQGNLATYALGFGASLAGAATDPLNYVPIFGPAARAAAVARFGRIGGYAALGSAEATIGTAVLQPFLAQSLHDRGEDLDAYDIAADLALSAAAGGILGGAAGGVSGWRERRALRALRSDGAQRAIDAQSLAIEALEAGDPVDVGPVLRGSLEKARERAVRRGFDVEAPEVTERPRVRLKETPEGPEVEVREFKLDIEVNGQKRTDLEARVIREALGEEPVTPQKRNTVLVDTEPAEGGGTYKMYEVRDADGKPLANVSTLVVGDEVIVESIYGKAFDKGGQNTIGPSGIRAALRAIADDNPTATKLIGNRVSGARFGGAHIGDEAGEFASVDLARARTPRPDPDFTVSRQPDPHPSIVAAEARVGKGGDELAEFREDAELDEPVEMIDVQQMEKAGELTEADKAELEDAVELEARAEKYATAYETMAGCVLRNAA